MSQSAEQTASTDNARRLRVEFDAGEIIIEPSTDSILACHLSALDDHDQDAVERVRTSRVGSRGEEVYVEVPRRKGPFSRGGGLQLLVQLPQGCNIVVDSGSADLRCTAIAGEVRVTSGSGEISFGRIEGTTSIDTGSGDVSIDSVDGDLDVKSGSGDVEIGRADGSTSITTGSGDLRLESLGGSTLLKAGSGDVEVTRAQADLKAATASGSVRVIRAEGSRVTAESASGDLRIGIADGMRAWLDVHTMSGDIDSRLEYTTAPANDERRIQIRARSISGDVQLLRA